MTDTEDVAEIEAGPLEAIADVISERLEKIDMANADRAEEVKAAIVEEVHERFAKIKDEIRDYTNAFESRLPALLAPILEPFRPEPDHQTAALAQSAIEAFDRVQYQKPPENKPTDMSGVEKELAKVAEELSALVKVVKDSQEQMATVIEKLAAKPKSRKATVKHGKDQSTVTFE